MKKIMDVNGEIASQNREGFLKKNIRVINIMASPGAGKTSVIMRICQYLKNRRIPVYVIEGDIASDLDAVKIEKMGVPVMQINTGGGCHLDANMLKVGVETLKPEDDAVLLLENVGNLVCPSAFDLGETCRLLIASVPEGDDKPYKYISIFGSADAVILNKIDLIDYTGFDYEYFKKGVEAVNQTANIYPISCITGEGLDRFLPKLTEEEITLS